MRKLIVIPAYNEEKNIVGTVNSILRDAPDFDYVIINDCSTDQTGKICREHGFNVVNLPINLGIGGAVQSGFAYGYEFGYDVAVQVDGDGQHDPAFLRRMSEIMIEEEADMVIGSRYLTHEGFQSSFSRRFGSRIISFCIRITTGKKITDPTSGLRMINHEVMGIFSKEYPRDYPEPESTAVLLNRGKKVIEIPVIMKERQGGVSSISLKKAVYYMLKVPLGILIERFRIH